MTFLPILSTVVTFIFTAAVFARYRKKGGMHLLLWTIGLLFYGIGTLCELTLAFTYSPFVLKMWYLTGAMLTAAWLGQGSVHLLIRKGKIAITLTYILAAVSVLAFALVMFAPVTGVPYDTSLPASVQYKDILTRSGLTIFLTIILNIYGTLTLVGGALYSAFLFWRKKILASRMFGNILIATGALFPAMAGTFVKAGIVDALYISELIGAILMYSGFVLATQGKDIKVETPELATAD